MTEPQTPIPFTAERERRTVAQVITTAKFRKPPNPRSCDLHRYHVWSWETLRNDPNWQPPSGTTCQCGCIAWTHREEPLFHGTR